MACRQLILNNVYIMKSSKYLLSIIVASAIGLVSAGCSEDKIYTTDFTEARPIGEITFDVTPTLPLAVGMDSTLVYHVGPASSDDLTIVFTTSDESVASVDQDGTIHARSLGECIVRATPPIGFGAEASVVVNVIPEVIKATSITIENTTPSGEDGVIYVTDKIQLKATILPENHTYSRLTWHSDNEHIATVDADGLVNCVGEGNVTITAKAHDHSGVEGAFSLTVKPYIAVTKVKIEQLASPICISRGSVALNVTYTPANGTLGSVEWTSLDESIVTVNRGEVTPTGFGTTTVIAKCIATGEEVQTSVTVDPGLWIWDAQNRWGESLRDNWKWSPADTKASDERLEKFWRVHFPDPGTGKWRRDIKIGCSEKNPVYLGLVKYPVLAIRCTMYPGGNFKSDLATLSGFDKPGEINPKQGIELDDGTRLMLFNVGSKLDGKGYDLIPFRIFQFKVADIPNDKVDRNAPWYDIYWIRTFESEDAAKVFAAKDVIDNPRN